MISCSLFSWKKTQFIIQPLDVTVSPKISKYYIQNCLPIQLRRRPWRKASGSSPWWRRSTSFPPDVAVPGTLSRLLPVGPLIFWRRRPRVYNEKKTGQECETEEIWLNRSWVRNCRQQVKTKQKKSLVTWRGLSVLSAILPPLLHRICCCFFIIFILLWNVECTIRICPRSRTNENVLMFSRCNGSPTAYLRSYYGKSSLQQVFLNNFWCQVFL